MRPSPRPLLSCLLAVALGASAGAEEEEGTVRFPHVAFDLARKTVTMEGAFVLGEMPLELLVCQGTLRDYEAMITSPCEPSHLHTCLVAMGLQPRVYDKEEPGKIVREGDPLDVRLRFAVDGKEVTVEPRELIVDLNTKKHIEATPFVFYGSLFVPDFRDEKREIYLANAEDWLIGLLGDTVSVVDLAAGHTGEYGALEIDRDAVPPKGTKVQIIIRPAPRRKAPEEEQPPDQGARPDAPQAARLVVGLQDDGTCAVAGRQVPPQELRRLLAGEGPEGQPRPRAILIRAHRRTPFRHIARLMEMCTRNEIPVCRLAVVAGPAGDAAGAAAEGPLETPVPARGAEAQLEREIWITVRKGGTEEEPRPAVQIDRRDMPGGTEEQVWEATGRALRQLAADAGATERSVILVPRPDVPHGWVMKLLDLLQKTGYRDINFKRNPSAE
ncbi:MAG: YdjY domain-containing protein [bacterium]